MSRESFYPYPGRPGSQMEHATAAIVDSLDLLSVDEIEAVLGFEQQLFNSKIEEEQFPLATEYKASIEAAGDTFETLKALWLKKIISADVGLAYFYTEDGASLFEQHTGISLLSKSEPEIRASIYGTDLHHVDSKKLDELRAKSVEYEEKRLTEAFVNSDYDASAVPEPTFITLYKNPEAILQKARGFRQIKLYLQWVARDLKTIEDPDPTTKAKLSLTQQYQSRVNDFIAEMYIEATKYCYQVRESNQVQNGLIRVLADTLPALLPDRPDQRAAHFMQRLDRYNHGVSVDDKQKFTFLSPEARELAQSAEDPQEADEYPRGEFEDYDLEFLQSHEITGETFGEWLKAVLTEYDLLSEHDEWDSEREGPTEDNKWQVIVNDQFKSLAVEDKQRIMKVPTKSTTLETAITVGNHEVTHVLQHENKRLVGRLAILQQIGLHDTSEQTESGGIWQEREAKQRLQGKTNTTISGTQYLKGILAKANGATFGQIVDSLFQDYQQKDPDKKPEKAAAMAVNRARRLYRSGGFEFAMQRNLVTNTQALSYLEQELIYNSLNDEQKRLLLIASIALPTLIEYDRIGLFDLDQLFVPDKMPWELMLAKVNEL